VTTCDHRVASSRHAVSRALRARLPRAIRAAEEATTRLDAVADDLAAAVIADRCHLVDGALEAVEHVPRTGRDELE